MGNFLGNGNPAVAAEGGGGAGRGALRRWPDDLGLAAVAIACAAGVVTWSALTAHGLTPDLGAAMVVLMANLAIGIWVSTHGHGRHHRTLVFVNLCASFIPLMIAMSRGGEFDPELVRIIYHALA